ncbi:MAG: S-methyl-5'-thioadenosine phosphorylase [Lentisphaeria bacterium]
MKLGIIGGSGLYDFKGVQNLTYQKVETPFGKPSDELACGTLNGVEVVFLARHGRGHALMPSEINFKANIYALKKLGVDRIISISAVGSFKEEIAPRDVVMVDQFVDRTKNSGSHTFFGDGIVAHIAFGDPVCHDLHNIVSTIANEVLAQKEAGPEGRPPMAHPSGTYLNMEGPAFSTKGESYLYKAWGMDVIGMTNLAEAKLAREAEMCYCTMAMVTDYDCWHEEHEAVSVDLVVKTLLENATTAQEIIRQAVTRISENPDCQCRSALKNAIITNPDHFPQETEQKLELLLV